MKHPLFGIQEGTTVSSMRLVYPVATTSDENLQGKNMTVDVFEHYLDDSNSTLYSKLEDVEDAAIDKITSSVKSSTFDIDFMSSSTNNIRDEFPVLSILIRRQAQLIATRTRRAAGNIAIVSQFIADAFIFFPSDQFLNPYTSTNSVPVEGSKLSFVGTLNNRIQVFVHPDWEASHPVIIAFTGTGEYIINDPSQDSGLLVGKTDDDYRLFADETTPGIGDWMDYYGVVGISESSIRKIEAEMNKDITHG